jgi:hypothetical protein
MRSDFRVALLGGLQSGRTRLRPAWADRWVKEVEELEAVDKWAYGELG